MASLTTALQPIHLVRTRTTFLLSTLLVLFAAAAASCSAAQEQELIATLQSTADASQKWAACQKLRVMGTSKAVPALAAMLTDERLSQAARYVLEALPGPEATTALSDGLGKTSGLLKAGIIDSLGWRGDAKTVSVVMPFLSDSDPNVGSAAAAALGRIGGREALAALSAARARVLAAVQPIVLESLLKCAERMAAANDAASAMAVYRDLNNTKYSVQIRTAAWRDLALADSAHRPDLIVKALAGTDRAVQVQALSLLRETTDRQVIQACTAQWPSLSPDSQLAVLDAQVKLGAEALPLVRLASQSNDLRLRVAGWQAFGQLNDAASIPALAKAAAQGEASEREAARESLERLHGPGVSEGLLAQVSSAPTPERTELLRALGERGDHVAVNVLLQNATSTVQPVRLAALGALSRLAPPEAATSLLKMAAHANSDNEREPVLNALYAACGASTGTESQQLVQMLEGFPVAERRPLLPLLAELGTADALAAAQTASRDSDLELAKAAVRVLAQWPNAAAAGPLFELAQSGTDPTLQALALRGAIQVASQEPEPAKRLALIERALADAKRIDEKKQALGQLGQIPTPEALSVALKSLTVPGLTDEAALAALTIAKTLAPTYPELADEAAGKVLAQVQDGEVARRAWTLKRKSSTSASFIRTWVVCGPYRQAGVVGATAVFDIPFGPEKPGAKIEWKTIPPADHINLGALFPQQENCAAYLQTRLIAPQDCQGLLLIGSDDGVKAWLNGKVVHSNNVDRGEVTDQDTAPITLKQGTNELLLKITQGGGGWSACARIVGKDFKPIPGLEAQ